MAKTGCKCGVGIWDGYVPGGVVWFFFPKWQAEEAVKANPECLIGEADDYIADHFNGGEFPDFWLCRRCRRIKIWGIDRKFVGYRKAPFSEDVLLDEILSMEEWLAYSDWDLEEERTLAYALEHPFRPHRYFLTKDQRRIYVYNTEMDNIEFMYVEETRELDDDLWRDEFGTFRYLYEQSAFGKVFKGGFYLDGTEVPHEDKNRQLSDAVYGAVIGDALGVPFEFQERDTFKCTGMVGYGTHNQPEGTWSDDTSMILATCKSIKDNNGKIVIEDIRNNFLKWVKYGEFTPFGKVFDCGITTRQALLTGVSQDGERSNGNGSLMRILPLAFIDSTDDEVRAVSDITHGHWISTEACVIYVNIIKACLAGKKLEDVVHSLELPKPFDRLRTIDSLSRSEIRSSGYVVDTLEAALWCVMTSEDYMECLCKAVNLGDDTDTVASVTGGLAGAVKFGFDSIIDDWVNKIKNNDLIQECLF